MRRIGDDGGLALLFFLKEFGRGTSVDFGEPLSRTLHGRMRKAVVFSDETGSAGISSIS